MPDETLDYESLWEQYSPQPRNWFSSKITYQGWGVATFENPAGTIEGPTKVVVDESGEMKVEMKYKKLNTDITVYGTGNFKFIKFAQGNIGSKKTEGIIGFGTGNSNPCLKLTVQTKAGRFTSIGKVFCSEGFGTDDKFRFYISEGVFETTSLEPAKYWVVPLVNFLSSFHRQTHPALTQHPLRLTTTPTVPAMQDVKKLNLAQHIANRANLLIWFYFDEKLGYIQPVLDYSDKEKKIKSGRVNQCITALMVGEVSETIPYIDNTNEKFPYDYVNLLSLATGADVGASWLEIRDKEGSLIKRKHLANSKMAYEKKYAVINEILHGGIGNLLTCAHSASEFRKTYFQVFLKQLLRMNSFRYHIEDQMALMCRAIDSLCKEFSIGGRALSPSLSDDYASEVNQILEDTESKLKRLSRKAKRDELLNESTVLIRLSEKVAQVAKNRDNDFGLRVKELLDRYGFADTKIMEDYYSDNQISWLQTLSLYRNIVIHEGYFHIQEGTHDFREILAIENHLHDLMVRITLKILGYEGEYQPRVARYSVEKRTSEWVKFDTTADELGYGDIE